MGGGSWELRLRQPGWVHNGRAGAVYQAVSGIVSGHVWGAAYWVVYATVDGVMKYARNDPNCPATPDFLRSSGAEV